MNIFYSTGMNSTKYGSFERMLVKLTQAMSARGHRIIIQYEEAPASKTFINDIQKADGKVVVIRTRGRLIKGFFDIYRYLKKESFDIVHANFSPAQDLCLFAGRLVGKVKIISHFRSITQRSRTGLRQFYLYRFTDVNLAVSEMVKKNLIERGALADKIHVLYNSVEIPAELRSKREACDLLRLEYSPLIVMCIAWDDPVKGVDLLLEAFSTIAKKAPETKLWIVGSACENEKNKELAKKLGISDSVMWLGIRSDIPILMNCCDIYVQPSRSDALPLSAVEAMAVSKPVVAFKVGGLLEVINDGITGILVEPENVLLLGEAMMYLLENPELRTKMGEAGRQRAIELFDINKEVELTVDLYEKNLK